MCKNNETEPIIKAIAIGSEARKPLCWVTSVFAVVGKGLEGDRYFFGKGSFNEKQFDQSVREVTLIAYESILLCNERLGLELKPEHFRRNIVTVGIDLLTLKDKEFEIGSARFKFERTAPPCKYLCRLLDADMMNGLKGIGGIRATILKSGSITINDALTPKN